MNKPRDVSYSWHLSLRADRPVEHCPIRPHAYMYGKKLDSGGENTSDKAQRKTSKGPPPKHEFSYIWWRSANFHETCSFESCPRRTSFSPHDWSTHALGGDSGGSACSLQCVSSQSNLYKAVFCNSNCFKEAWKTQYTVVAPAASTPRLSRSHSVGSNEDMYDETGSVRSTGSSLGYDMGSPIPNGTGSSNVTPRGYNPYSDTAMDDENWTQVSCESVYVPGPEDVGHKLRIQAAAYDSETGKLLMSRVIKTEVVLSTAPPPLPRAFVSAKSGSADRQSPRFRLATFNVLAEIYATQQQYPYCDFWALNWDYRFSLLMAQIANAQADAVCLQEVQADHYENHIYPAMAEAGYEGVYKQKTRQSMGLVGKVDGCALFWRQAKFHLVESYSIEFNEIAQRQATQVLGLNPRSDEGGTFLNRLSKDNIAQLVVLEFVQPSRTGGSTTRSSVCIANTHLYSHKDFPDVKLWQGWQLLQELESFIMNRTNTLPLVLTGDFNSTPDTAVYDLISRQQVHPGHPDMNNEDAILANTLPDASNISHSFRLGSAYNAVMGHEPWVTNFTVNFQGVLDYIWYSALHLRPLAVAPVPPKEQLTRCGSALPNTEHSSDHVMLIADFQLIQGSVSTGR